MKAVRAGEALVLTGPPAGAAALVRVPPRGRVLPVTLKLPDGPAVHRAYLRPFGEDASEIRLRLPPGTPPGTYRGQATLGGAEVEVAVVVEQVLQLRARPKRSAFTVRPGTRVEFDLDLANAGNVSVEVPGAVTLDFDETAGQDRALGRALRATLAPGERRVDRFFEEMREMHGGEATLTIAAGAGPIGPGETRELRCVLDVPASALPGRSYLGAWRVANASHVIVLEVEGSGRGTGNGPDEKNGGRTARGGKTA